jgi:DNA-binding beta-propeller fold protein YncE
LTIAPTDGSPSRSLDVAGNVEPEAFSSDDSNLFVLQYIPAEAPVGYQVRRVDLSTGELHNIRTDDSELDKPMAGRARTQVLSPDGTRLYTLYVVTDSTDPSGGYAFVHVLDLVKKEAFCIDLPNPFGTGEATTYAIAISPDGKHVYTVDPLHGLVVDLDTANMEIAKTVAVPAMQSSSIVAAAGVGGRLFLGAGTELLSLEPSSLSIQQQWTLDGPTAAVITTAFDDNVYVAVNDVISVFKGADIASGPISRTELFGAPGLVAADPVPPVDARGPVGCAC